MTTFLHGNNNDDSWQKCPQNYSLATKLKHSAESLYVFSTEFIQKHSYLFVSSNVTITESFIVDILHFVLVFYLCIGPWVFPKSYYPILLIWACFVFIVWATRFFGAYKCPLEGLSKELLEKEGIPQELGIWERTKSYLQVTFGENAGNGIFIPIILMFNVIYMAKYVISKYKIPVFVDYHVKYISMFGIMVLCYAYYVIHYD